MSFGSGTLGERARELLQDTNSKNRRLQEDDHWLNDIYLQQSFRDLRQADGQYRNTKLCTTCQKWESQLSSDSTISHGYDDQLHVISDRDFWFSEPEFVGQQLYEAVCV